MIGDWNFLPRLWTGTLPEPSVSPLSGDEAEAACDLHARSFARGWDGPEWQRLLADRAIVADGLHADGGRRLIGLILSRVVLDEAEVLTIAVDPSCRKQGCGRRLLTAHLESLARHGTRQLFLEVGETNAAARHLYERMGFREIGRRPAYYPLANGTRIAAICMGRAV